MMMVGILFVSGLFLMMVLFSQKQEMVPGTPGQFVLLGWDWVEQQWKARILDNAQSEYRLGNYYFIHHRYDEAEHWLSKAATQGHLDAQYDLAILLLSVKKNDKDSVRAMSLLENAAIKGHFNSKLELEKLGQRGSNL